MSWTAPADGGSPITSYTVIPGTSGNEGTTELTPIQVTGSPPPTSVTVPGLTNGTTYIFTVEANNAIGTSQPTQSSGVTPVTTPGAPTSVSATAGPGSATVTWTAPASNGGGAIAGFTRSLPLSVRPPSRR